MTLLKIMVWLTTIGLLCLSIILEQQVVASLLVILMIIGAATKLKEYEKKDQDKDKEEAAND